MPPNWQETFITETCFIVNYAVHFVIRRTDLDQGKSGVFGRDSRVGSLALHPAVIVLEDSDGVLEAVNLGLAQGDVDVGQ